MIVRAAEPAEFMEMAQMGREFWRLTDFAAIEYRPDSVCRQLEVMHEQGLLLVAVESDVIVGFIGGLKSPLYANDDFTVATELFWWVVPECRKGGAALALMLAFEKAGRKAGCDFCAMSALESVDPDRAEAIYERAGYTRTERTFIKGL